MYGRWLPLVLVLCVTAMLVWVDGRLKTAALAGYCPEDARWAAVSSDAPGFWSGVDREILRARLAPEGLYPLQDLQLSFRKKTGLRPTPGRWRLWCGPRLLAAEWEGEVGFCVRPGVLLRMLSFFQGNPVAGPSEYNLYTFGETTYGWRDGFLVFSESPAYVDAALSAPPYVPDTELQARELSIEWRGALRWRVTLHAAEELPVEGWVEAHFEPSESPLRLADAWPERPLFSVAGARLEDLGTLSADWIDALPCGDFLRRLMEETRSVLDGPWLEGGTEFALALLDVDTSEALAVPELALVLGGVEGEGLLPPAPEGSRPPYAFGDALPYEWGGFPGWAMPWMGEKLSLFVAADDRDRYITSQEPLMAGLLGNLDLGDSVEADLVVTADWAKGAEVAQSLLRRAAAQELVPRMNERDVEKSLIPLAQMAGLLGRMRITGFADESGLHFKGFLALVNGTVAEPETATREDT